MSNVVLEMKNITKEFPGVKALSNVNFKIYDGKVMALLGENGAGKSTLMKILTGVYQKTSGEMIYKGEKVEFKNTKMSQEKGISIIHQELNLIPGLTVAENIFLGREPINNLRKIDWNKMFGDAKKLLEELGIAFSPKILVSELSIGHQQMVEIAKALSFNAEVIVMDEPTDALTTKETESLFTVIRKLRSEGKSMVYITHRLDEVFEICDYATVLRDGQFIGENAIEQLNKDKIIELMVGRTLTEQYPRIDVKRGKKVLAIDKLTNEYIKDISFDLYEGEIVGIAGLMGSMRTELAKTIYGVYEVKSGDILIDGKQVKIHSPVDAINNGIAYVSEDRKADGLILGLSIKENISISTLKELSGFLGKITTSEEEKRAKKFVDDMSIRTPSIHQKVKNLSGGNQQKVSISKSLMKGPKILILDEPTRGVDVGAKKEIYMLINKFKKEGMSILMISSEMPEIMGLSDRIMVMNEGEVTGYLDREQASQEAIMKYAVGMKEE